MPLLERVVRTRLVGVVSARNEVYVGLGASAVTIRVLRPSIVTVAVAFFDRRGLTSANEPTAP